MTIEEFNSAFKKYRYSLFVFAKKYTESNAEDIVSMVFVKLWQSDLSFKHNNQLKSWLYNTVKNAAFDLNKSAYSRNFTGLNDDQFKDEDAKNIELAEIESEIIIAINEAKNLLQKAEQDIIDLYYFKGYNANQIASMRGISIITIHNQLTKARKKLMLLIDHELVNDYLNDAN